MDIAVQAADPDVLLTPEQRARRERALREALASATIEGGKVGPEAQAVMTDWTAGLIDDATMLARVDALHVR